MMNFCTITTYDHLYKTLALADSLIQVAPACHIHVLCIDRAANADLHKQVSFYSLCDVQEMEGYEAISKKYARQMDRYRWSLKPVFLMYLLRRKADKIIYIDNDIYFYGDPDFLFGLLEHNDILLTPHHYPRDPNKNQNWLEANYRVGLYNAGFIGVNKNAITTIKWWAECCAYRCEKNALRGVFDDQKYLDLVPIINEKTHIVRHKGCNVAEWNRTVISRSIANDGRVVLDGHHPLVFVHYNQTTIRAICSGDEPCLETVWETYLQNLKKYRPEMEPKEMYRSDKWIDRMKYYIWKVATELNM